MEYSTPQIPTVKKKKNIRTWWLLFSALAFFVGVGSGWLINEQIFHRSNPQVQGEQVEKTYPLLRYSFPNLINRPAIASPIEVSRVAKTDKEFTSYVVNYTSEGRKISGMLNVPNTPEATKSALPTIVMIRGYVPPEEYETGKGTQHIAERFAKKGYITIAPDFLGFGESDPEPSGLFEGRFIKPIVVHDLLASIEISSGSALVHNKKDIAMFDTQKVGIWGHSNGGQIAISTLEITGRAFPTSLWAPVTKQFPYSILFFTDDYEDQGKALRATVAQFERDYNIDEFTIGKYLDRITSKLQLHQGTLDDAVPKSWSDDFYSLMVGKGKKDQIEYFVYDKADHGLFPAVDEAFARDLKFFDRELGVKRTFSDLIEKK